MNHAATNNKQHRSGCYLYAVVKSSAPFRKAAVTGISGAPIYALSEGETTAIISDIQATRIRPERRHIAAHHKVLRHLMEIDSLLPMAFGIIADCPTEVRQMLNIHQRSFLDHLRRLSGKVEMGLRVILETSNEFDYYVRRFPELRMLRDQMLQNGSRREDMVEVGRRFEEILEQARDQAYETITQTLDAVCLENRRNAVKEVKEVVNMACLVARDGLADFEGAVNKAAKQFDDDHVVFRYNGPWPPHNFVTIDVAL
ncbi:GvpL/GvpF family gas vesicle protein [Methylohalobius crimeensis]|uniref:GvpL/GvpF family gas vesicle protein n=1 Tax=Methylohalobius crimeensis TaxID=244365 RepID=UPI0003B52B22|nr:GvpL/GvpF family gas vesicle protein [Methylohalobius crimeensis]